MLFLILLKKITCLCQSTSANLSTYLNVDKICKRCGTKCFISEYILFYMQLGPNNTANTRVLFVDIPESAQKNNLKQCLRNFYICNFFYKQSILNVLIQNNYARRYKPFTHNLYHKYESTLIYYVSYVINYLQSLCFSVVCNFNYFAKGVAFR